MNTHARKEPKLPATLANYKPGRAILRHLRRWLAEMPDDRTAYGMTEERRLELRFSLIFASAFGAYCIAEIHGTTPKGLPRLSRVEREELDTLLRAISFGPHGDNPAMSLQPRNDNERTYWELLQASAREAIFHTRALKSERHVVKLRPDAERGAKMLNAASKGGREAARQCHEPTREQYHAELVEYRLKNPRVSLTAARARIAKRYGVVRRTVERHTKDLSRK